MKRILSTKPEQHFPTAHACCSGFPPAARDSELNNEIAYLSSRSYEYTSIDRFFIVYHKGMY
jgi:hypothetical protein